MPETIYADDLSKSTATSYEVGTIVVKRSTTGHDHAIRRTDRAKSWKSITVETTSTSSVPYRDDVTTYDVTFEGGTPSASRGWELPFATHSPFDRKFWENTKTFPPKTMEEREAEHVELIKKIIKPLVGWTDDFTVSRTHGLATYLRSFEHVHGDHFSNTYRLVVVRPYCD